MIDADDQTELERRRLELNERRSHGRVDQEPVAWRIPLILLCGFVVGVAVWLVWVFPWGPTMTALQCAGAIGSAAIGLVLIRQKFGRRVPGAAGVAMVLGFGILWTLEASSDETGLFLAGLMLFSAPSVAAGAAADYTVAKLVGRSNHSHEDQEPVAWRIPLVVLCGFVVGVAVWLVWVFPWGPTMTALQGAGAIGSAGIGLVLTRQKFGQRLPGAAGVAMALGFGLLWTYSSTDETGWWFLVGLLLYSAPSIVAGAAADYTVAKLVGRTDAQRGLPH